VRNGHAAGKAARTARQDADQERETETNGEAVSGNRKTKGELTWLKTS
jgi:hypothetical protein